MLTNTELSPKQIERLKAHWLMYDYFRRELNRWHKEQLKKIKEEK